MICKHPRKNFELIGFNEDSDEDGNDPQGNARPCFKCLKCKKRYWFGGLHWHKIPRNNREAYLRLTLFPTSLVKTKRVYKPLDTHQSCWSWPNCDTVGCHKD